MMRAHRQSRIMIVLLALALLLSGCSKSPEKEPDEVEKHLTVIASFYPIYAAANIVTHGIPNMTLYCLTQPLDMCPRDYVLSEWDAGVLSQADLVILGGAGLENFSLPDNIPTISLMTGAELLSPEGNSESDEDTGDHFAGGIPWLWLSLDGMEDMIDTVAARMSAADPEYSEAYLKNAEDAIRHIETFRDECEEKLLKSDIPSIAVMHEGLFYIAEAFDLYVGAVIKREPGGDLDGQSLQNALDTLESAGVGTVLIEEQAPDRLVNDLTNAGIKAVRIDTFTRHTSNDPDEWFYMMENNLEAILNSIG